MENVVCWEFPGSHLGCKALDKLLVFQVSVSIWKMGCDVVQLPRRSNRRKQDSEGLKKSEELWGRFWEGKACKKHYYSLIYLFLTGFHVPQPGLGLQPRA